MDRFTRGFIAGVVAAIIEFAVGLILYFLNLTDLLWHNFAGIMIFGRTPHFWGERVFAEIGVWFFSGLMGVVFAYLIGNSNSRNYLLKGFVYAETVWFFSFAITLLFKVPELEIIAFKTAVSNFILSAIWGVLNAEILRRLDKREVV